MTKDQVNKAFDDQIKRDTFRFRQTNDSRIKYDIEMHKINKEIFNLTFNFTMNDWRLVRDSEYWSVFDTLDFYRGKQYTLQCVRNYLKQAND